MRDLGKNWKIKTSRCYLRTVNCTRFLSTHTHLAEFNDSISFPVIPLTLTFAGRFINVCGHTLPCLLWRISRGFTYTYWPKCILIIKFWPKWICSSPAKSWVMIRVCKLHNCPVSLNLNAYISQARASPDFNSAARALSVLFCLLYIFFKLALFKRRRWTRVVENLKLLSNYASRWCHWVVASQITGNSMICLMACSLTIKNTW